MTGFARDFGIDRTRCEDSLLAKALLLTAVCNEQAWRALGPQAVGDYLTQRVLAPQNVRQRLAYSRHQPPQQQQDSDAPSPTRAVTWSPQTWQALCKFLIPHDDHNVALYRNGERKMTKRHECAAFVQFDNTLHAAASTASPYQSLPLWIVGAFASAQRQTDVKAALAADSDDIKDWASTALTSAKVNHTATDEADLTAGASYREVATVLRAAALHPSVACPSCTTTTHEDEDSDPSDPAVRQRFHPDKATQAGSREVTGCAETPAQYVDAVDRMLHQFAASIGFGSTKPLHEVEFAYVLAGMPNAANLMAHFYRDELDSVQQRIQGALAHQRDVVGVPFHDNDIYAHLLTRTIVPTRLNLRGANRELAFSRTALHQPLEEFLSAYEPGTTGGGGGAAADSSSNNNTGHILPLERRLGMWLMHASQGLYPHRFAVHFGAQTGAQERALADYRRDHPAPTVNEMEALRQLYFTDPTHNDAAELFF